MSKSTSVFSLRTTWQSLNDPNRVRLIALLQQEELSVAELQQILRLSQPLISTHLSVLRKAKLVITRREGKNNYYSVSPEWPESVVRIVDSARSLLSEVPEAEGDRKELKAVLQKRRVDAQNYFNRVAGRLGKAYCPGRTWSAVGPLLAQMVPKVTVADLGAGEGWLTLLLAQRAKQVIAVDNSNKMVAFAKKELKAKKITNVEYRLGDLSDPPIDPASVELVVLSQSLHHAVNPRQAIKAASKLLVKGGRLIVLDLLQHHFEQARTLYHDHWLGFSESELQSWLSEEGLKHITVQLLTPDEKQNNLIPILASGEKV